MKSLQELKNRLQKFTFGKSQKIQNEKATAPKKRITKSFSKDEDTFMFI